MTLKSERAVLFILGTPYSGSTALGNYLNAHPDVTFLGEVDRFDPFNRYGGNPAHRLRQCFVCDTHEPYACPYWDEDAVLRASVEGSIAFGYESLLSGFPGRVLVDGSKYVRWMQDLMLSGLSMPVKVVVLARNPFGYALSENEATGKPYWQAAEGWRNLYEHTFRVLAKFGVGFIVIRHEDILGNPDVMMNKLYEFMGVGSGEYWRDYLSEPSHSLGGNVASYINFPAFDLNEFSMKNPEDYRKYSSKIALYKESITLSSMVDRWQHQLSKNDISSIINMPGLLDVATLLGYDLPRMIMEI